MEKKIEKKKIYFLSSKENKFEEVKEILEQLLDKVEIIHAKKKIDEIQNKDIELIVKDKLIKAFNKIKYPVIVEQTGLFLKDLNGFPGGLTQIFWESLGSEKFCEYFSTKENRSGEIKIQSVVGYCDGKKIKIFSGMIDGIVVDLPRGSTNFEWDCIIQPNGYKKTFGEMEKTEKNEISMRRKALERLAYDIVGGIDE